MVAFSVVTVIVVDRQCN